MNREQEIEELLKIDIQYKRCNTEEQRQFVKDHLDAMLERMGYDKTRSILRHEILSTKVIDVFEKEQAHYGEMMESLAKCIASLLVTFAKDPYNVSNDVAHLFTILMKILHDNYNIPESLDQKKFKRIFQPEQFKGETE